MTHDFKAALDGVMKSSFISNIDPQAAHIKGIDKSHLETIIAALRIADKLMQYPSPDMIKQAVAAYVNNSGNAYNVWNEVFKAMRDQMLSELNISSEPSIIPSAADTSQNIEHESK